MTKRFLKQIITLLSTILLLNNIDVCAQITFQNYSVYTTNSAPTVVSIGDLNNDSLNDVVLCTGYGVETDTANDNRSFVFLQNKNGILEKPIRYINSSFTPFAVAICDINNDQRNDLIIAFNDSLGIFYQDSKSSLMPMNSFFTGNYERIDGLTTGDFNNDGLIDAAVTYSNQNKVSIMYQKFNGSFRNSTITFSKSTISQQNRAIISGFVNSDELIDIVINTNIGVFVLLQNTNGTFDLPALIPINTTQTAIGIAIGDVNHDGQNDIVQTTSGTGTFSDIYIHYNTGNDLPDSTIIVSSLQNAESVIIADLNCDSIPEIITANGGTKSLCMYEHKKGIVQAFQTITMADANHFNAYGMAADDINNDGKKDLVIADYKNGLITLINNTSKTGASCCIKPETPNKPVGKNSICTKGITEYYSISNDLGESIIWNISPLTSGTIVSSTKTNCTVTWNDSFIGRATITATASNACGVVTSTPLIITIGIPALELGNDTTICDGSTITIRGTDAYDSYQWHNTQSNDSIITIQTAGLYKLTAGNACGMVSDSINIKTYQPVDITMPTQATICDGKSYSINTSSVDILLWRWNDGVKTSTRTFTKGGTYTLTTTDINKCKQSKSITLTEVKSPNISLPNDIVVCDSLSKPISLQCTDCSFLWNDKSTLANRKITKSGTYSVSATNACGLVVDSVSVNIAKSPLVNSIADTSICEGNTEIFKVATNEKCTFTWHDGNNDSSYKVTKSGNYSCTVTNLFGCKTTIGFTVTTKKKPQFKIPNDSIFCDSISLPISISCNDCSFMWHDNDTVSERILTEEGKYSITATNSCGIFTDSITLTQKNCSSFIDLPSAFSPNGDLNNDMLYPVGKNISDINLKIYSRTGMLLFTSNEQNPGWDGRYNNRDAEEGIYLFLLTAKRLSDGVLITKQGSITLVR